MCGERRRNEKEIFGIEIDERTAVLFAADCLERVLPILEKPENFSSYPRIAIETTKRFACDKASREEFYSAYDAIWSDSRFEERKSQWNQKQNTIAHIAWGKALYAMSQLIWAAILLMPELDQNRGWTAVEDIANLSAATIAWDKTAAHPIIIREDIWKEEQAWQLAHIKDLTQQQI